MKQMITKQISAYIRTKRTLATVIVFCSFMTLFAQESVITSGGVATGSGGTVSYSTGQPFSKSWKGSNGIVTQGVQLPYEVYHLTSVDDAPDISLDITASPNPATDVLLLRISDMEIKDMAYRLFDMNGRILKSEKVTDNVTTIEMMPLPPSVYILKVMAGKSDIVTFKIVKR